MGLVIVTIKVTSWEELDTSKDLGEANTNASSPSTQEWHHNTQIHLPKPLCKGD